MPVKVQFLWSMTQGTGKCAGEAGGKAGFPGLLPTSLQSVMVQACACSYLANATLSEAIGSLHSDP